MNIKWRYFSLEQINSQRGNHWKIWEHFEDGDSRGLRAFWAAEAARRQGELAFGKFHLALLLAKHEQQRNIADMSTLLEIAENTGLNMVHFRQDINDHRLLAKLAEDHTFAVSMLGVFGTPTLVFDKSRAIFLKMDEPPPPEECLSLFAELRRFAQERWYIQEIKRPQL